MKRGKEAKVCLQEPEPCWTKGTLGKEGECWAVFDNSQRTNVVTAQVREAGGPRGIKLWKMELKGKLKSRLKEEVSHDFIQ